MTEAVPPTRVACYGWVDADAGSMPSSNYLVVRELTRRGIRVDMFANEEHISPPAGLPSDRFRYLGVSPPRLNRLIDRLPNVPAAALHRLLMPAVNAAWRRTFLPLASEMHRLHPYDAVLALGTPAHFDLDGVPTITWLQGPVSTELEAIRGLRAQITGAGGRPFYVGLTAMYRWSNPILLRKLRSSERIVVGSEWSRRALVNEGFETGKVHAVPHAIDLERFDPEPRAPIDWERPQILALGRLDPRKRLDLMLDAFELLLHDYPDATLRVVGRPGYVPGGLSLIDRSSVRARVRYEPSVQRDRVPTLIRESALLLQASENENFGSSVAEALACGTPVVVGPSNGTGEFIDGNSRVFERYAPESVAEAMVSVLRNRQDRPEQVRQSARAAAERWFDARATTDRLLTVINAAIAEARSP